MINFQVFGLVRFWLMLKDEEDLAFGLTRHEARDRFAEGMGSTMPPSRLSDKQLERVRGLIGYAKQLCSQLQLQASEARIVRFEIRLRDGIDTAGVAAELRALREAIDDELNFRYFYRYRQNEALVLLKFESDWQLINSKFPTAKEDAHAAVDCWALDHPTASVFHLMRVAELGLRALAKETRVKLPRKQVLEWAEWQTVIDGIKKKADAIANKRRGPKRAAALEFYRGALASVEGFKDAYRNNVSHTRKPYNPSEATVVREHVFHFMNRLAEKTDENGSRIKWEIR